MVNGVDGEPGYPVPVSVMAKASVLGRGYVTPQRLQTQAETVMDQWLKARYAWKMTVQTVTCSVIYVMYIVHDIIS